MRDDMANLSTRGIASRKRSLPNLFSRLLLVLALIASPPTAAEPRPPNIQKEEQVCHADSSDDSCRADPSDNQWAFMESLSPEDALIEWIRTMDRGMVASDKFRIERTPTVERPDDSNFTETMNPEFEFYATTDIPKGEILMEIPKAAMIGDFVSRNQDQVLQRFLDKSEEEDKDHVPMCMSVELITYERLKGNKSFYRPFIEFIFGIGNPRFKRPADWSKSGQFIFWGMLGRVGTVYTPSRDRHYVKPNRICKIYREQAQEFRDRTEPEFDKPVPPSVRFMTNNRAYDYFARHSWGNLLIPLFDLIPHRNGKWKNVEARFVDASTGSPMPVLARKKRFRGFVFEQEDSNDDPSDPNKKLVVYAHRDIAAGEPLRVSYNQCEHLGCEILQVNYTSGDLMADRGFLEDYPRRWSLNVDPYETGLSRDFVYDIDVDPEDESKRAVRLVQSNLLEDEIYKLAILSASIKRWNGLLWELEDLMDDFDNNSDREIFECNSIWDYYHAYTESFHLGWQNRYAKINATNEQDTLEGYDDLSKPTGVAAKTVGRYMVCAEGEVVDDGWLIGSSRSFYQNLQFYYEDELINSYMKMNLWLHTSSNFRAHYHESVIHVALQYVENPKRVVYIGGGDNMVLSEVMKYPGIELVVGMELDQQVCRSSMKYFGTSPLYHDERVEWWYGNGANALQIIPEEYFGSFDLVLVDLLTDVAESVKVALNLNIAEVAALLMKPDGGLIARNEDSPDRTTINNRMARRVVMYDYYDVPRLCITSVNIASNSVDFMKGKRYDHGVNTIMRLKDFENDTFTGWSRYYDSSTTDLQTRTFDWTTYDSKACEKIKKALPEFTENSISSGVLQVIDAENVAAALNDLPTIHSKIGTVVKEHGLTLIAQSHHPSTDLNAYIVMFLEGYIKVQLYPDAQYVAFDLMLWGGAWVAEKSEAMKQDLVASVGGGTAEGSVSSYKISTLGMKSGNNHNEKNGLAEKALAYYCENDDSVGTNGKNDTIDIDKLIKDNETTESESGEEGEKETHNDIAMEQVFDPFAIINEVISDLVVRRAERNEKTAVLIFCGKKDANDCVNYASVTANVMDGEGEIESVFHPFYSCDSFEDMGKCELETTERLLDFTKEYKTLDGFVLDPSVSLDMGMVVHKVFNNTKIQGEIFDQPFFGLTPTDVKSSWRNLLLDRFRTEMVAISPIYKADFEVSNETHKEAWSVVVVGNSQFHSSLDDYLGNVEAKSGLTTVTKTILNGLLPVTMDWNPKKVTDKEFFEEEVMQQWIHQKPLSSQFLIQMQVGSTQVPLEKNEKVLVGKEYRTDGVGGIPITYEYHEATVSQVIGDEYRIQTTIPNTHIRKSNNNAVPRDQIRKFSPIEHDRRAHLDVGDVVLSQYRQPETLEVEPTHWYVAYVKEVTAEGIWVTPKDLEFCIDLMIPLKELLVYDESPEFRKRAEGISIEIIESAFDEAIIQAGFSQNDDAHAQSFRVGDVSFTTFISSLGSGVITWDGTENVEANIFITEEESEDHLVNAIAKFETAFLKAVPSPRIVARDVFPRGHGKVVSFKHELFWKNDKGHNVRYVPHWMNDRVTEDMRMKLDDYIQEEDEGDYEYWEPGDVADAEEEFDLETGFPFDEDDYDDLEDED